jgi:hypothetical protein
VLENKAMDKASHALSAKGKQKYQNGKTYPTNIF